MLTKLYNWLFPLKCGSYRSHCYHRNSEERAKSAGGCTIYTHYWVFFRECCRCGKRTGEHTF